MTSSNAELKEEARRWIDGHLRRVDDLWQEMVDDFAMSKRIPRERAERIMDEA